MPYNRLLSTFIPFIEADEGDRGNQLMLFD